MVKSAPPRSTRHARVDAGVALLRQTLADLVRQGLARRGEDALETLERRLVDAQAPGLAAAVARVAHDPDPERLVLGLGRLWLLSDAWLALDGLPTALQADVRTALGIPTTAAAVRAHADTTEDEWCVLGCAVEVDELRDLHTTRTWLVGKASGRVALHLVFVGGMGAPRRSREPRLPGAASAPAPEDAALVPGTTFRGTLAFWPSAAPQRALVVERGEARTLEMLRLPGRTGIREALDAYAALMARQPFLWRAVVVLGDVKVAPGGEPGRGHVVDGDVALPFATPHALTLYALTGGLACDLVCEWDGRALRPLAVHGREGLVALEAPDE